jgi:uncharacterized tellurite resistance protein B-like protein
MGKPAELVEQVRQFVKKLENGVTAQTAAVALGRLMPLARDGVGHHVVVMAVYGDVFRLLAIAIAEDSKFSREEQTRVQAILEETVRRFARYRRDYAEFVVGDDANLTKAMQFFVSDTKAFGFACKPTRMAGMNICRNLDKHHGDAALETEYRQLLDRLIDWTCESEADGKSAQRLRRELETSGEASHVEVGAIIDSRLPDLAAVRIHCEAHLFEEVLQFPAAKEVAESYDAVRKVSETRSAMLRDGVRVSKRILPKVMATVSRLREVIGGDVPCEAFVWNQPAVNAFVTLHDDMAIVGLSSAAVHQLTGPGELEFVIGHELGHVLFGHIRIPAEAVLRRPGLTVREAMRIRAWQRAQEISADRVGLHLCGSLEGATRAFFKLQAGVSLAEHSFDTEEFVGQWDQLAAEITSLGQRDLWDCSHPVSPLRVRAMAMHWAAWKKPEPERQAALKDADESIERMLAMLDPSGVCDRTSGSDAILAPFYFWGGLYVAMADGDLSATETERLQELAPPAFDATEPFRLAKSSPEVCIKKFEEDLGSRRRKLSAIELFRIMSGVLDVACSDGDLSSAERRRLRDVGELLGLHDVACELVIDRYLSGQEK